MFQIEIIAKDAGCPLRCITCPDSIRKMEGSHRDNIPKAFQMLQEKLKGTPFGISFTDDFLDIMPILNLFNVKHVETLTTYVKLQSDPDIFKNILEQVVTKFPNANLRLAILERKTELPPENIERIVKMATLFFETKLKALEFNILNNSQAFHSFQETEMETADRNYYQAIFKRIGGEYRDNYESNKSEFEVFYRSHINIKKSKKYFIVKRRVIATNQRDSILEMKYYMLKAKRLAYLPEIFTPENAMITLTPIGVRILHSAVDIENPYFWLTYEELFSFLKNSKDIYEFCGKVKSTVDVTLKLDLDEKYFRTITETSIDELSAIRKNLIFA